MSTIAGLQNTDIQKHAIVRLLDAFELDIDPEDGRIYIPDDPTIQLRVNGKILCVSIGKRKNPEYTAFNPLVREDHAQYLMQLAVYSQIFAGKLKDEEITDADFTLTTAKLDRDENGVIYPEEMTEIEVVDKNFKICGRGIHEDPAMATTYAVLDYLNQEEFITDSIYKELLVVLEKASDEYKRLQELGAFTRKQEMWDKDQIFRGPEIEDDGESFYDGPLELDEEEELEWTEADLAVETKDEDFEKADNDAWVDSDYTGDELQSLFGWYPDVEPEEEPEENNEAEWEFVDSVDDDFTQPEVSKMTIVDIEAPAYVAQNNTVPMLPAPETPNVPAEDDFTQFGNIGGFGQSPQFPMNQYDVYRPVEYANGPGYDTPDGDDDDMTRFS
jgi:hypothetical protein